MMVLITYDVSTIDKAGQSRLRKVARVCVNYGQRVQNSVFECSLDPGQLLIVKEKLRDIIDHTEDSLRFYNLGKNWSRRLEVMGKNDSYNPDSDLLIL